MTIYNKKDIIRINQEIGETGAFHNESSLDFALHIIRAKKSWLYELIYLVRSLLIDHVFHDGNKRTTFLLITLYFDDHKKGYDDQRIVNAVRKIARKNLTDINKIARELKKCLIK